MVPVVIPTGYCSTVGDNSTLKPTWRFDLNIMVFDEEFGTPFVLEQDNGLHPESDNRTNTTTAEK